MKPEFDIEAHSWPLASLGEGLQLLARHAGLARGAQGELPNQVPTSVLGSALDEMDRWLLWASQRLDLETESVSSPVPQFDAILRRGGPALLHFHHPLHGRRFVLLLSGAGARVRLITPEGRLQRCTREPLRAALCAGFELPLLPGIERLLDEAAVPAARRPAARRALLAERLAGQRVEGCWLLRQGAGSNFWHQLLHARLPQRLGGVLALFAGLYALEIAGWQLIGEAALNGRFDAGWMAAWVLLLLSLVPLRALSGWMDAGFALHCGRLLKQRLLAGALRLDLDLVRQQGAGQLLGRVMESQALEGLALSGGVGVVVAALELAFAAWILSVGAAGALHLAVLGLWLLFSLALSGRYLVLLQRWTQHRMEMTNALVERMVGHRTALAQERAERREAADDLSLQGYLQISRQMDHAIAPIVAIVPAGWIVLGLAALGPAFVSGSATPGLLAVSLGGILFAHRALGGISNGLSSLARAALAWRRVKPLFKAGAQTPAGAREPFIADAQLRVQPAGAAGAAAECMASPLIAASQLVFGYRADAEPVLRGADLHIQSGERILLQGPSGGGKSTLAALLVGLRQPGRGLLLLNGLDRHTLGESWHRLATEAPQFHENHLLTGTLGFNLLMGRNWPASPAELQEAQTLCEELGLGPLIARMPAGLQQRVGETGWQLSHGERSRIFLARALLQQAPLTVLDESFAALDAQTLKRCLECALRRTQTLIVIAHP
jgi:ATP-binding cassette subfamily B protein